VAVSTITLDSLLRKYEPPFLKVDIERGEYSLARAREAGRLSIRPGLPHGVPLGQGLGRIGDAHRDALRGAQVGDGRAIDLYPEASQATTKGKVGMKRTAIALVLMLLGIACTKDVTPPAEATTTPNATTPCATTTTVPSWSHVVWVVFENKRYSQIIGTSTASYFNSLASKCGLATNFKAESHPSLPNYIAMTSGGTQGITDDKDPSAHKLTVPSIFSQLGTGWKSLEEAMPSNCYQGNSGNYAVRHNPAVYFTNVRTQCNSQDVPLGSTPNISARFTFVTPNLCNDMHDCSVSIGDKWLSTFMPKILNSSTYAAGHTAVIVTFDEDDYSSTNQVATIVVSPSTPKGIRSGTAFTHYSLLKTTEQMLGLSQIGNAAGAASMRSAFHI
jgi:phosphatidylinositol-3-phosphatase